MSFRIRSLIAVALLLVAQYAGARPTACCVVTESAGLDICGEWAAGAHALYFAPLTCPFGFANVSNQTIGELDIINSKARTVSCRPDWGFRLFGNYLSGCLFAGVRYQWLDLTTTVSTIATNIAGGGIAGQARVRGQVGIEYQNFDVRLGTYVQQGCSSVFYIYGNVRWVDLSHRRAASFVRLSDQSNESFTEKSQLQGGAVGIGIGGEVVVGCGVGAFMDGNVLGVIGARSLRDVKYRQLQTGVQFRDLQLRYPSDTCIVPEADVRLGISYTSKFGCWEFVGEIGYEVDYFWQGSAFPTFNSDELVQSSQVFSLVCEDVGFSGLFFGAHLVF